MSSSCSYILNIDTDLDILCKTISEICNLGELTALEFGCKGGESLNRGVGVTITNLRPSASKYYHGISKVTGKISIDFAIDKFDNREIGLTKAFECISTLLRSGNFDAPLHYNMETLIMSRIDGVMRLYNDSGIFSPNFEPPAPKYFDTPYIYCEKNRIE